MTFVLDETTRIQSRSIYATRQPWWENISQKKEYDTLAGDLN